MSGTTGEATVSAARQKSPLPLRRCAGVCMHLTSLPGAYGIGELGDSALEFVDSLAEAGLEIWQFLPTGPTAYGDSPYQPLSIFAGNELLVDIQELIHLDLLTEAEAAPLRKLPASTVDYGALIPLKNELLSLAAGRFESRAPESMKDACARFVTTHDPAWLHDYALYRILKSRHSELPWVSWDRRCIHRDAAALRRIEDTEADRIAEIKTIQFLFHHQWDRLRTHAEARGVLLFGDMPIYIAFDSADAWAHPEILRVDRDGHPDPVAGVPPDYFSEEGQLWGNPLYDWNFHARNGFRWWVDRLRHTAELVHLVRIDHFRGFEACWAVPAGASSARAGAWEPGPGDALFDAMRQALGELPIIAEDLGEITPAVDALRKRQRIPGMKVLQFLAGDPDFRAADIEEECVCYTGTHDNDTVVGWFQGGPGDTRTPRQIRAMQKAVLSHTGGSAETIHLDLTRLAFESRARIAIAQMQDFLGLGSDSRLNTPGTTVNNWRWRLRRDQFDDELRRLIRTLVTASDR